MIYARRFQLMRISRPRAPWKVFITISKLSIIPKEIWAYFSQNRVYFNATRLYISLAYLNF